MTLNRLSFAPAFLALAALLPLSGGCGAARGIINSQIPTINDPAKLDGKQFPATVASSGTATGSFTGPFADQSPVANQGRLTFADVRQPLRPEVALLPPAGMTGPITPPATVTLRGVTLRVRLYEAPSQGTAATREVVFPALTGGDAPLTFSNVAGTNRYTLPDSLGIELGPARISGDDARRLFSLLTSPGADGSTTNYVETSLSATVEGGTLPAGASVVFTFGPGEARVGI
jgi:hypothetical protein